MANCKYCGKSKSLFSRSHKECENKHESGLCEFDRLCNDYFNNLISVSDLVKGRLRLHNDNYLSEEDIVMIADNAIRNYTDNIKRPFVPSQLNLVDSYIQTIGVSFAILNRTGAVDSFCQKLLKGFMVDYFTDHLPLSSAKSRCQRVISTLPIDVNKENEAYLYVLDKAVRNFLSDGLMTDQEQLKIEQYVSELSLPINNLPAQFNGSDLEKLGQVTVLKNFERGILPAKTINIPVLLGKGESALWTFNGVTVYEEKIQREWVGRSRGLSFRICKGVYYRTGGSKGHPVEHSSMQPIGTGTLYVTNKNLIFHSLMKAVKIPYRKIVGVTPYSDGIELHRDGTNVKRMTIQGFDPWFVMNLMSMIAE